MGLAAAGTPRHGSTADYGVHLDDAELARIARLARARAGVRIDAAKRQLLEGRLTRALRALELAAVGDLLRRVEAGDPRAEAVFVDTVTTNTTAFFREGHHFEHLASMLPAAAERNRVSRRLRIWSAGCSTGQEPYTIAMVLRETMPGLDGWDAKILATDLNPRVLEVGRRGVYDPGQLRGLDEVRRARWLERRPDGSARVADSLRELVHFRRLNLHGPWPMRGRFDFVFCRNVVIYFDESAQRALFERLAAVLSPHGHLYVGHSESLACFLSDLTLVAQSTFARDGA